MSTLKADTIQSTGGGAATLTKQEAMKVWVNYVATAQAVDGSRNNSLSLLVAQEILHLLKQTPFQQQQTSVAHSGVGIR